MSRRMLRRSYCYLGELGIVKATRKSDSACLWLPFEQTREILTIWDASEDCEMVDIGCEMPLAKPCTASSLRLFILTTDLFSISAFIGVFMKLSKKEYSALSCMW